MAPSDCMLGKGKMQALALAGEIIPCIQHICELGFGLVWFGEGRQETLLFRTFSCCDKLVSSLTSRALAALGS